MLPNALLFGPAGQGDVYRLLALPLKRIILIDGVFHGQPAVWQRELLAAMAAGIEVIGAASMGALRAAECGAYGMLGIGEIYAAYAAGRLDGDDEVALLHGDAHHDYRPLSLPLVNVRATLAATTRQRLLESDAARRLLTAAVALPFTERTWTTLCQKAAVPTATAAVLRAHTADLKAADTQRCLRWAARNPPTTRRDDPWWAPAFRQNQRYHADSARRARGLRHGAGLVTLGAVWDHLQTTDHWAAVLKEVRSDWVWRRLLRATNETTLAGDLAASAVAPARQGLSQREWAAAESAHTADRAWLDKQAPAALPLTARPLVAALAQQFGWPEPEAQQQFGLLFLLAEWATQQGLRPGAADLAPFKQALAGANITDATAWPDFVQQAATGSWVLVQSPATLGLADDDLAAYALETLQRRGDIAAFAETLAPTPLPQPQPTRAAVGPNPAIGDNLFPSNLSTTATRQTGLDENGPRFCTDAEDGGQRIRRPEDTLRRMRPHWARFGITRLADVTRLDLDFGVPTICAHRPTALVLQTSNGKGLTRAAAQVSALMEAVELWHAENPPADLPISDAATLGALGETCLTWNGPAARHTPAPGRRMGWVTAESLDRRRRIQVPADMVWFTTPSFGRTTTNGLASGNHRLEAEIHAVYECLERDALARLDHHGTLQLSSQSRILDLTTIPHGRLHKVIARIESSDCRLKVVVVPTRAGRITCWAFLIDPNPAAKVSTLNSGAGCHHHPLVALSRAVTEAVQSRLSFVHGGREDIIAKAVGQTGADNRATTNRVVAHLCGLQANTAYHDLNQNSATFADLNETHRRLCHDLEAAKLATWSVRLTKPGLPIEVVKVLIPALAFHRKLA